MSVRLIDLSVLSEPRIFFQPNQTFFSPTPLQFTTKFYFNPSVFYTRYDTSSWVDVSSRRLVSHYETSPRVFSVPRVIQSSTTYLFTTTSQFHHFRSPSCGTVHTWVLAWTPTLSHGYRDDCGGHGRSLKVSLGIDLSWSLPSRQCKDNPS